jgi:hypothetical protein
MNLNGVDDGGSIPGRSRDFFWVPYSLLSSELQWTLFPVLNCPGSEGGPFTSSSVRVKNAWNYTSTPLYVFVAWYLAKHRWDRITTVVVLAEYQTGSGLHLSFSTHSALNTLKAHLPVLGICFV